MLTLVLTELESDELITNKVYQEVPLRVVYALTSTGKEFLLFIKQMRTWGEGKMSLKRVDIHSMFFGNVLAGCFRFFARLVIVLNLRGKQVCSCALILLFRCMSGAVLKLLLCLAYQTKLVEFK